MKLNTLSASVLVGLIALLAINARADNMASIAISPSTGELTLVPRWGIGGSLAGFHHMAQDLSLGGGANQFYSIKGTAIPAGGDVAAFNLYIAGSGAATAHADIGSKLKPNSYSALTSADPDVGFGAVNLYFIHHKDSGDYFSAIVPSSGTASAVTDLKPMSGPGGPATLGDSGYFGLTFSAADLGYGLNNFYFLRNDPVTGSTKFGVMVPGLAGASTDKFDLGISGFKALAFTGSDVGYGNNKMYYLRLDPVTGFTIFGTLHPTTGKKSDVANLGSVFSALTFVPGDVGFGSSSFYTVGSVNPTWQSVSFAAIADRQISTGSFTVKPTASSTLPITLSVVSSSTGAASISAPVAGVFTVTPTAPGLITLQATQAGQPAPAFEYNMLRQSFTATGTALLAITSQPTAQSKSAGGTATFSVTASGSTPVTYQWRRNAANITGNTSATTAKLTLSNVQSPTSGSYDVKVTNASGAILSKAVNLTVTAVVVPVIGNVTPPAGITAGAPFSYTITASGSPTSFTASPLPAGITLNPATGVLSGTPTTAGKTSVVLTATNANGTSTTKTLTVTVGAASTAGSPVFTSANPPAGVTAGAPFTYTIATTGGSTGFTASPLPPGVVINPSTGVLSGTPTIAGTTAVVVTATNAAGTSSTTISITVAAPAGVVGPSISTQPVGQNVAVGSSVTFTTGATGTPTPAYQWYLDGVVIPGATGSTLTITDVQPADLGSYEATLTNSGGQTTTNPVVLSTPSSRVSNFSARAISGPGDQTLIMGFVVSGDNKTLLVRGIGPGLASAGVANTLIDPMLTLFDAGAAVATNDNWEVNAVGANQAASLITAGSKVGAFPLLAGSKDSALLLSVNRGAHTTGLLRQNSSTGVALTEIYDMNSGTSARLINVSARMHVSTGDGVLIAGFVIAGNVPARVLIRGVGPALASYGVGGTLADPRIAVYAGATLVAGNDNWSTSSSSVGQLTAAFAQVGAFALPSGSADAALLLNLAPGAYTVQVSGVGDTAGVALVEIYDTQ